MSNNSIKLFNKFSDLPALDWERIIPTENIFMRMPYISVVEEEHKKDMRFQYALIYKEEEPVAAGYFQIMDFSGQELKSYIPKNKFRGLLYQFNNHIQRFLDCSLNRIKWKLLMAGNVFVTGEHGFYFNEKLTTEEALQLLHQSMQMISKRLNGKEKINVFLISDFYKHQADEDQVLLKRNYRKLYIDADMVLSLDPSWNQFEDYLESVSSKYRVRANKVLSASSEVEKREMSLVQIEENRELLFELYKGVAERSNFNLAYLSKNYLPELKRNLGEKFVVFAYYLEEKMVGFISAFELEKVIEVHFVGLDYRYLKKLRIYQRILYDLVQLGIDKKVEKVHYGRTAPESKSTIGAVPVEMFSYLKHANPISNMAIKPLTAYLKPQDWIQRSPFKQQQLT